MSVPARDHNSNSKLHTGGGLIGKGNGPDRSGDGSGSSFTFGFGFGFGGAFGVALPRALALPFGSRLGFV